MRFIGNKYPDFGGWWGDWFANGWFDEIEKAMGSAVRGAFAARTYGRI